MQMGENFTIATTERRRGRCLLWQFNSAGSSCQPQAPSPVNAHSISRSLQTRRERA